MLIEQPLSHRVVTDPMLEPNVARDVAIAEAKRSIRASLEARGIHTMPPRDATACHFLESIEGGSGEIVLEVIGLEVELRGGSRDGEILLGVPYGEPEIASDGEVYQPAGLRSSTWNRIYALRAQQEPAGL